MTYGTCCQTLKQVANITKSNMFCLFAFYYCAKYSTTTNKPETARNILCKDSRSKTKTKKNKTKKEMTATEQPTQPLATAFPIRWFLVIVGVLVVSISQQLFNVVYSTVSTLAVNKNIRCLTYYFGIAHIPIQFVRRIATF